MAWFWSLKSGDASDDVFLLLRKYYNDTLCGSHVEESNTHCFHMSRDCINLSL
jgi:hypothetical protein